MDQIGQRLFQGKWWEKKSYGQFSNIGFGAFRCKRPKRSHMPKIRKIRASIKGKAAAVVSLYAGVPCAAVCGHVRPCPPWTSPPAEPLTTIVRPAPSATDKVDLFAVKKRNWSCGLGRRCNNSALDVDIISAQPIWNPCLVSERINSISHRLYYLVSLSVSSW